MKRVIGAGLIVIVVVGALARHGESESPTNVRDFMRAKLSHSQKVLEGLTTET
jgi:hypothetical protein